MSRSNISTLGILLMVVGIWGLFDPDLSTFYSVHTSPSKPPARLAKVTIAYPPLPKQHQQALNLHRAQNERFRYAQYTMQRPIVKGGANILYFVSSLITTELQKPVEEQVEWIL